MPLSGVLVVVAVATLLCASGMACPNTCTYKGVECTGAACPDGARCTRKYCPEELRYTTRSLEDRAAAIGDIPMSTMLMVALGIAAAIYVIGRNDRRQSRALRREGVSA